MIIIQHCDFSFKDIVGTQLRLTTVTYNNPLSDKY